jgi:hypothetical protein
VPDLDRHVGFSKPSRSGTTPAKHKPVIESGPNRRGWEGSATSNVTASRYIG